MRIVIAGAGPAGLYCAYRLRKELGPHADIDLVEQNPAGATWGFGVVFSDQALDFLEAGDPEVLEAILPHMERWRDLTVNIHGESIVVDGVGFTAIGRLKLLQILQGLVRDSGVRVRFEHRVQTPGELPDADLIIGADGVNSIVRGALAESFGTTISFHSNKFVWYGTTRPFRTLTQTFRANGHGEFNVHHYRYAPDMSTFIVETNAATWSNAGFEHLDDEETRRYFEDLFAPELDGHPIVMNHSHWRNFPVMSNRKWWHENRVLIGDALHTAHFSIGSGTRLAMEDALYLVHSLKSRLPDLEAALADFEARRRPMVEKLVAAANASMDWYGDFGARMKLPPHEFVLSYLKRSGRMTNDQLRRFAPGFMAQYDAFKGAA